MAGPSGIILSNVKVETQARVTLNNHPAQLTDLAQGMAVSVCFAADSLALNAVAAVSPPVPPRYILREVAPDQRTITVSLDYDQLWTLEKLPVADNAQIEIHTAQGVRKATLKDLEARMTVQLEMAPDD